jgi:hypothetical protein
MLLVAVCRHSFFNPGTSGYVLSNWIGAAATIVTLPAALAVVTAAAGTWLVR